MNPGGGAPPAEKREGIGTGLDIPGKRGAGAMLGAAGIGNPAPIATERE